MGKKKLRKQYEKPKRLWDKERIERESKLQKDYGLKNKHELWRMQTMLRKMRRQARQLLAAKDEKQEKDLLAHVSTFLVRKEALSLDDVLGLDVRSILERRLCTIVVRKGMARTMTQARQFIAHGHVSVKGSRVNSPSYLVRFSEEPDVSWYGKPLIASAGGESAKEEKAVVANV